MRISLNWLKKFVKIKVPDDELVTLIGARLVEVEGAIDETHKYDKIFVVRVEKAEKIPDTHLTKCLINVGGTARELAKVETDEKGLVHVMCGAPNVREGMLAVWIAPGAIVPASVHEDAPFVIGKRKMLGKYDSYGMLAGADELDFGDDHSGIVEINPEEAQPGDLLADVFELNDLILDIENKSLTHRPDCFGMVGFAREVAGILGEAFSPELAFSGSRAHAESFLQHFAQSSSRSQVTRLGRGNVGENDTGSHGIVSEKVSSGLISIQNPEICERYTAIVLEKHGELKKKYLSLEDTILSKSGMRPLDPVVDATNYLMLLTGQPLHAFDYDKFVAVGKNETPRIVVRTAKKGEKLELLDDKEIELNENDIVICSNDTPVALAGAMGGKNTAIDENTKRIILESATFSLYNLRKTQMEHGIFTEAITRFTKGQPACQTLAVAEMAAEMLKGGFRVSEIADECPHPEKPKTVEIDTKEINTLLGTSYKTAEIVETLENVGFEVLKDEEDAKKSANQEISTLTIRVPEWRRDIAIKEDIIEEIGRLKGYDNIEPTLPRHYTASENKMLKLKTLTRDYLARLGANEVLSYSFVSGKILEKAGQDPKNSYKIINSISPELQFVRQSLVPSLLEKAYVNQKIPYDEFALFEINKVYEKSWGLDEEKVPIEKMRLGLVLSERKNQGTAYYKAKMYLEKLCRSLHLSTLEFKPLVEKSAMARPFEPKRSAGVYFDGDLIGVVGEFKRNVLKEFKLAHFTAGFEIDFDKLLELIEKAQPEIKIAAITDIQDLTIETDKTYAEVIAKIKKILAQNKVAAEISPISIYQPGEKKHVSVRLKFSTPVPKDLMKNLEKA